MHKWPQMFAISKNSAKDNFAIDIPKPPQLNVIDLDNSI